MAVLLDEVRPDVERRSAPSRAVVGLGLGLCLAAVLIVLLTAEKGPEGRILVDRPAESWPQLWGYDHWIATVQIVTLIATSAFLAHFVLWTRRHGRLHPASGLARWRRLPAAQKGFQVASRVIFR